MLWIKNLQSYCVIFPTATKGSTDAPGKGKRVFPERLEATLLALLLWGSSQAPPLRIVEINYYVIKVMQNCKMMLVKRKLLIIWCDKSSCSHEKKELILWLYAVLT